MASDANAPGSTPGGTLKLDSGYHLLWVDEYVAISKQWLLKIADVNYQDINHLSGIKRMGGK